ncbi:hypothetical protein I4U23_017518 [Adineta vaga]|nr:hypothetical protein I4U23_017518 [Adineta vaga]
MRQLGSEENAALLLSADEDNDEDDLHHRITHSPSSPSNDRFPVVAKRPRTYHRHQTATSQPILCFILLLGAFVLGCVTGVAIVLYQFSQSTDSRTSTSNSYQQNLNVDLSIQTKLSQAITKPTSSI